MRQYRQWSEASRQKLSASKMGKTHKPETKQKIASSMRTYWKGIEPKPAEKPQRKPVQTHFGDCGGKVMKQKPVPPEECHPLQHYMFKMKPLPQETPQETPPEPTINNDVGLWEEIIRDLPTYQGKVSAKNGNNNNE